MLIVAALFIAWDVIFTRIGVWGFNDNYLAGVTLINLPVEEWLFFITVPYACVFIYDCIKAYFPGWTFGDGGRKLAFILGVILITVGVSNYDKLYTSVTFTGLAVFLFVSYFLKAGFLGRFFISYLIILVPFLIVNGVLTGSGIEEHIVWYDHSQNLDFRILTIPVEDAFYGMWLILGNVSLYEYFQPD